MSKTKAKSPSKSAKSNPKTFVKVPIKNKTQGNGLHAPKQRGAARTDASIDEKALSSPMQAGLAVVAALTAANETPVKETKLTRVIALLSRPDGASLDDIIEATGWQKHTVRAAISHALGKKRGYQIVSEKAKDGKRTYKIAKPEQ